MGSDELSVARTARCQSPDGQRPVDTPRNDGLIVLEKTSDSQMSVIGSGDQFAEKRTLQPRGTNAQKVMAKPVVTDTDSALV